MAKILEYRKPRISPLRVADTAGVLSLELGNALEKYGHWPSPTAIVSDGPYGLSKFPGDLNGEESLGEWYALHIATWSKQALPETTLWFWCSEVGWAEVHSVLKLHGWRYKAAHIWDKGIGYITGNCNSDTIRGFPAVSEICVQYQRDIQFRDYGSQPCSMKHWLRSEWLRSGFPLYKTNDACGVKNAATRKYFTQCHLWYFPSPDKMEELARYANKYGKKTDKPYSIIGWKDLFIGIPVGKDEVKMESCTRGNERLAITRLFEAWRELKRKGLKSLHANQKPLVLMERIINASTEMGDVVWEPFGGLCSATVAVLRNGRSCYAAEVYQSISILQPRE